MFTMHIKLIVGALVLLAVGGGSYVYVENGSKSEAPSEGVVVDTAGSIMVTVLADDVFISQKGSLDVVKVNKQATTSVGATIRTSSTGRALITSLDKRMVLDSDTQITIPAENNEKVSTIVLLGGSIWSRVEKIFERGEYFEIKTQNTVAAVRGTSFNVTYQDGITTVEVEESAVAVTPIDETSGEPELDKMVVTSVGEKAVMKHRAEKMLVSKMTKDDTERAWFKFNKQLEEKRIKEVKEKEEREDKRDKGDSENKKDSVEAAKKRLNEANESLKESLREKANEKAKLLQSKTETETETKKQEEKKGKEKKEKEVLQGEEQKIQATSSSESETSKRKKKNDDNKSEEEQEEKEKSDSRLDKVELKDISPSKISEKSSETLTLQGQGLSRTVGVFLTRKGLESSISLRFKIVDDTTITFLLSGAIKPDVYTVVVANDQEQGASLKEALTIF